MRCELNRGLLGFGSLVGRGDFVCELAEFFLPGQFAIQLKVILKAACSPARELLYVDARVALAASQSMIALKRQPSST